MKRIILKKETIVNLTAEQMNKVRGATIFLISCLCKDTESCSIFIGCCPPPEKKLIEKNTV